MLALFSVNEASLHQNGSTSVSANRGNLKLNRLDCQVNYDIYEGRSNRGKGKRKGYNCSL
jgi:hypothetical protein